MDIADDRIERRTVAVEVARALRERILKGRYAANEFIRQEEVAHQLGVSRLPVREALAQLESEGLVIREKHRGFLVPELSVSEIKEIYDLRLMIEPYLLGEAIDNMTAAHLRTVKDVVRRSREAGKDTAAWATLNVEFHHRLYSLADRPLVLQVLENLLVRADRYLKMQRVLSDATRAESDAQHQRILDLVAKGQKNEAINALQEHIAWNAKDVQHSVDGLTKDD